MVDGTEYDEDMGIYELQGVITSIPVLVDTKDNVFEVMLTRKVKRPSKTHIQHNFLRFPMDHYKEIFELLGKQIVAFTARTYDEATGFYFMSLMEYTEIDLEAAK